MPSFAQKEFKNNLIKGFIGIFLLLICIMYLYVNTGERISLLGGLETIGQRINIFVVRMAGGDYRILEQKINQQAGLEDIMQKVKHATCDNKELYSDIKSVYDEIEHMNIEKYKQQLGSIISSEQALYQEFQQTCK